MSLTFEPIVKGPIFLSHIYDLSRRLLHSVFMALLGFFTTSSLRHRTHLIQLRATSPFLSTGGTVQRERDHLLVVP